MTLHRSPLPTDGSPGSHDRAWSAPGHPSRRRRMRRGLAASAAVAALVLLAAVPASAHVRVLPEQTAAGGWTALTFRVPNESADAGTTQVAVSLPTGTPLLSVSTRPVPGWTATVETATLPEPVDADGATITQAPSRVVWTADAGTQIGAGQFQEFEISAGPLPAEGTTLVLPTEQTYSDGTVVSWDEVATGGGEEPEHPAPSFVVTAAAEDARTAATDDSTASGEADDTAAGTGTGTTSTTAPVDASSDPLARVLGGAGLLLGVVAALLALDGRRRRTAGAGATGTTSAGPHA
ncbi:MAG TPA: YcnI family protein [Cellulomonas sp.]